MFSFRKLLEEKIRRRVGLEERAFRIVEKLVDGCISEDKLKDAVSADNVFFTYLALIPLWDILLVQCPLQNFFSLTVTKTCMCFLTYLHKKAQ